MLCDKAANGKACENGGTASGIVSSDNCACICVQGYTGLNCEVGPSVDVSPSPSAMPPKIFYLISSFVDITGMSPVEFNEDMAKIKSFRQVLSRLLAVAFDRIRHVRACASGTTQEQCPLQDVRGGEGGRRRTRGSPGRPIRRRLDDGEETRTNSVIFYDVVVESAVDARMVEANIQKLSSGEFTDQLSQNMATNGVDTSVANTVTARPSQRTTTTMSEQDPFEGKNDEINGKNDEIDSDSDQRVENPPSEEVNDSKSQVGLILSILGGVFAVTGLIILTVVLRKSRGRRSRRMSMIPEVEIRMNPMEEKPRTEASSPIPCEVPGWEMLTEKASGQAYYYNPLSGETRWDKPTARDVSAVGDTKADKTDKTETSSEADDWVEHVDPASGDKYYHSEKMSRTTWTEHMVGGNVAATGLLETITEFSETDKTDKTDKTKASSEADDWVELVDPATGDKYYHSEKKSRTTWTEHMVGGNVAAIGFLETTTEVSEDKA